MVRSYGLSYGVRLLRLIWLRAVLASGLIGGSAAGADTTGNAEANATDATESSTVTIRSAWFDSPQHSPQRVDLPDTWALRGADGAQQGHYRFDFDLHGAPGEPQALLLTRLSARHRIWVNDALVSSAGQQPSRSTPSRPVLTLVVLSPALLRPNGNAVVVETSGGPRAGLSHIEVGDLATLRARAQHHLLLYATLPQAANGAASALALLVLAIWWRRRTEVALGAFGALSLLISLRSYGILLVESLGPQPLGDWFIYYGFLTHPWSVFFLGVFAQHFAQVRWRRYTQALLLMAVTLSVAGCWAIALGHTAAARSASYPVAILACMPSFWLCVRGARRLGAPALLLQLAGIGGLITASMRDFAMQSLGWMSIEDGHWIPLVSPFALMTVSLGLIQRIVAALSRVEGVSAELELRVTERTQELQAANAAKTRFLASASHDLRQPLVAIGLLVGLARERAGSAQVARLLAKADQSVVAMQGLLTGLLDLSRLQSGGVAVRMQPVNVGRLFEAIQAHEAPQALQKGLRLRFRPTDTVVWSDPVLLEAALRNLVSNAVRYTERGGVLVAARYRQGGRLSIEVWDSGVGIAAQDQAQIFEEFVQLAGAPAQRAEQAFGLGLGLSIVHRSLDLLGHELTLHSEPGRGSRFAIWTDVSENVGANSSADLPANVGTSVRAGQLAAADLRGVRIVLVEDHPAVRDALHAQLQAWGAEVQSFSDLLPLRDWLASEPADTHAVVSDFMLGTGTGLDVLDLLRARHQSSSGENLPCVLITGEALSADLLQLRAAGVPVLHKPFQAEQLLGALQAQLCPR